ncbi:MAG TPA: tail fiber domain-containing protein [Verrucomicrobiae bacterium]|nr:tail fiber domain-containing protein [Verrucomicrobiae bacterium]
MTIRRPFLSAFLVVCLALGGLAQTAVISAPVSSTAAVPNVINYSGVLADLNGRALSGIQGVTFLLYSSQQGGTPVWMETQNITPGRNGQYTTTLGATTARGLPSDLFATGEARWLAVQVVGQPEQPRVLLVAVPYALKAADAQTLGGLPASAFVLAAPTGAQSTTQLTTAASSSSNGLLPANAAVTGSGTANYIPIWDTTNDIISSVMTQTGTGTSAKIGINTTTPAATLDVNGGLTVRGLFNLAAAGTAKSSGGVLSRPLGFVAQTYNSSTNATANQVFHWQAEPVGNDTASPSATLNLLFATAPATAAETGLHIASNGQITFATGQTFPGTGTISGVTAGTALTGGGTTGKITLNIDTTKVPLLSASNVFTGSQTVNGNLSATGVVTGSSFQIGGGLFGFGSLASSDAFLGFAGNSSSTGTSNTATGPGALGSDSTGSSNVANGFSALADNGVGNNNTALGVAALELSTSGNNNTATGDAALISSTTGSFNTASGSQALGGDTTGSQNTAAGGDALMNNATGSYNTAIGYNAGPDSSSTNLINSTAIGANAVVSASNSLVLGGTGVNAVKVGIGTATPASTLDVHGNANFTGLITFAVGQTFPGTSTISGVTAGTGLTGGGTSGTVTLNVDTTKVVTAVTAGSGLTGGGVGGVETLNIDTAKIPQLAAANTFTGNQTVNGNLASTGVVSGSSYQIGSTLFAFGTDWAGNAFLGYAGNTATASNGYALANTGVGFQSLSANDQGYNNTATGTYALWDNTEGSGNTATGVTALDNNSTGSLNTADGSGSLYYNSTGSYNTAVGRCAGCTADSSAMTGSGNTFLGNQSSASIGSLNNAAAIGAQALVSENNALVLGSINGVNSATADTNVGIGTTAPAARLHIGSTKGATTGLRVDGPSSAATGAFAISLGGYGDFGVDAYGTAAGRFVVKESGNVGVAVASPTHVFQIGQGKGNAYADGWSTYSSRRWKTNIRTLPDALARVEQLRGVSYDLKGGGKHEIGLIAEEVGQVVPEVVSFEANGKDAQGVDYSRLTALLIEATKEQQKLIHQQQLQIARLQSQMRTIQASLKTSRRNGSEVRSVKTQVVRPAVSRNALHR